MTATFDEQVRGSTPARTIDPSAMPEYGWDEILCHDKPGDYWIVLCGGVYDISDWLHRHPGGVEILVDQYGRDATPFFDEIGHSEAALHMVASFQVGRLAPDAEAPDPPAPRRQRDAPDNPADVYVYRTR